MKTYEQRKHHNKINGVPEVTGFSHHHRNHADTFQPHIHPGDMEIVYIGGGEVKWWAEKELYNLRGGDVYITFPDEAHGSFEDMCDPCELYWITVELNDAKNLCGLKKAESDQLLKALQNLPRRHFRASPIFKTMFTHLCSECCNYQSAHSQFNPHQLRALLSACLWQLVTCSQITASGSLVSDPITQSLRIMQQHLKEPVCLDKIAQQIGYSLAHFKDIFRKEMGISPGKYYLRRRAFAAAAEIKDTTKNLLEITHEFSFSSSQYLATCIKRELGKTPTQLRKEQQ